LSQILLFILVCSLAVAFAFLPWQRAIWLFLPLCFLLLSGHVFSAFLLGLLFFFLPGILKERKKRNLNRKLDRQLPAFLDALANSLRAGIALEGALKKSRLHQQTPLKEALEDIISENELGRPLEQALEKQIQKWEAPLFRQFLQAAMLARKSGLNASRIFEDFSRQARQNLETLERIRSLSAQGRLQALVLCLLPLAVGFFIYLLDPERMLHFLKDPRGQILVAAALLLESLGWIWIKRLMRI
jgi:tight adherence protein B